MFNHDFKGWNGLVLLINYFNINNIKLYREVQFSSGMMSIKLDLVILAE